MANGPLASLPAMETLEASCQQLSGDNNNERDRVFLFLSDRPGPGFAEGQVSVSTF